MYGFVKKICKRCFKGFESSPDQASKVCGSCLVFLIEQDKKLKAASEKSGLDFHSMLAFYNSIDYSKAPKPKVKAAKVERAPGSASGVDWAAAGRKAWETRKRNAAMKLGLSAT